MSRFKRSISLLTITAMLSASIAPAYAGFGSNAEVKPVVPKTSGAVVMEESSGGFFSKLGSSVKSAATSVGGAVSSAGSSVGGALSSVTGGLTGDGDRISWTDEDNANALWAQQALAGNAPEIKDDLGMIDPSNPKEAAKMFAAAKAVVDKYRGREFTELTSDQQMEIANAYVPLLRYKQLSAKMAQQEKQNATGLSEILLPPKSSAVVKIKGFCTDKHWPAPNSKDALTWRPLDHLIDPAIQPLYTSVMSYSAAHPQEGLNTQRIVWHIRHQCKVSSNTISILPEADLDMLDKAYPDGANTLTSWCEDANKSSALFDMAKPFLPDQAKDLLLRGQQAKGQYDSAQSLVALSQGDMTLDNMSAMANNIQGLGLPAGSRLNNAKSLISDINNAKKSSEKLFAMADPTTRSDVATYEELLGLVQGHPEGESEEKLTGLSRVGNVAIKDLQSSGGRLTRDYLMSNPSSLPAVVNLHEYTANGDRKAQGTALSHGTILSSDASNKYNDKATLKKIDASMDYLNKGIKADNTVLGSATLASIRDGIVEFSGIKPEAAYDVIDFIAGNTPVIQNVLSAYQAITGKHWLTGAELTRLDRGISALNVLPGAKYAGNVYRLSAKGYDLAKQAGNMKSVKRVSDAIRQSDLVAEHATGLNRGAGLVSNGISMAGTGLKAIDSFSSKSVNMAKSADGTLYKVVSAKFFTKGTDAYKGTTVIANGVFVINSNVAGSLGIDPI